MRIGVKLGVILTLMIIIIQSIIIIRESNALVRPLEQPTCPTPFTTPISGEASNWQSNGDKACERAENEAKRECEENLKNTGKKCKKPPCVFEGKCHTVTYSPFMVTINNRPNPNIPLGSWYCEATSSANAICRDP